ncbi:MAG TPA: VWA domain-containing protein [Candidatus Limnocylindrales bacterium]|nr:VWA domain-containing protein [Candidatus Limnocylindrales bacterium]
MSFIWPPLLLLLLAIPLGLWAYRSRECGREGRAAEFGRGRAAMGAAASSPIGRRTRWTRRIPAACTVLGVTILVLSLARPQSVIGVPRLEGTVLLAFDVSGSMAATDVAPTRMEAAKAAALAFIDDQPTSVRIGVVVFSDSGVSTQAPTGDRAAVIAAIQRLEPERGTSLGQGILASLKAIEADTDPNITDYYTNASAPPTPVATPVPAGVYEPAIIVLLSDGENTVRPDPVEAAQIAKDRGVRIHTVGIGSAAGATLEVEGFMVHTQLDEAALQDIATMTDGTYHAAADEADLTAIYQDIGRRLVVRTEPFELTPILAALGFALLLVGGVGSLRWFGRMP